MTGRGKQGIITFKVDESLRQALEGISNRSEFIRSAIQTALKNVCPLCRGNGTLTPAQQKHWESFALTHPLQECDDCHAFHLVCVASDEDSATGD